MKRENAHEKNDKQWKKNDKKWKEKMEMKKHD